jgi:hypothetical protein
MHQRPHPQLPSQKYSEIGTDKLVSHLIRWIVNFMLSPRIQVRAHFTLIRQSTQSIFQVKMQKQTSICLLVVVYEVLHNRDYAFTLNALNHWLNHNFAKVRVTACERASEKEKVSEKRERDRE